MKINGLLLLATLSPLLGCSSMPLLPGGSNLATVGYVNDANQKTLESDLPARMDAMLVDDRKQIAQLQQRVISQATEIEAANRQLTSLSQQIEQLGKEMQSQAETFQSLAENLRATTTRLDATLSGLPTDTLRLFSDALQSYLAARDAQPPPVEAAKVQPGDAAQAPKPEGG
jgi:septal ring factor EnvC (AmiA/AmiB activator)